MPTLSSLLIAIIWAMAAAAGAVVLHRFGGVGPEIAGLSGAAMFLLLLQGQAAFSAARQRRATGTAIAKLRAANAEIARALAASEARMTEIATSFEDAARTRNEKIVSELRVLETLVKDFADKLAARPQDEPAVVERRAERLTAHPPAPHMAQDELLDVVRQALEENRVDLYLQPVVSLPQRKVRLYEAFTRLRSADGGVIAPADYLDVAGPAGLMPVIDNLLLFRCVQLVRRTLSRSRNGLAVVCNISVHSLSDAAFFPQFLEFMQHNRDLASQIVFEFTQEALAACGPREDAALRYLASLGFTFSMDKVTRLDLDFAGLRERNVRYLKVPCATLLGSMGDAKAAVQAGDFKELIGRHGLSLVVEKIERERDVVDLLEFNVDFGQGYLFGEPRPVREPAIEAEAAKPARLAG